MAGAEPRTLVLGIGNVLLGDEGIGVHVVRRLEERGLPEHCRALDGGTGGLQLLGELQSAERVVLVDATVDGGPPGRARTLHPRFSSDYPRTLTAHDIGLKDLLDAFHLLGDGPEVTLVAISVDPPLDLETALSPELARRVDALADLVREEVEAGGAR